MFNEDEIKNTFDGEDREHLLEISRVNKKEILHSDLISSTTGIIFSNANSDQIDSFVTNPHDNWLMFPVLEAFPTFDYNIDPTREKFKGLVIEAMTEFEGSKIYQDKAYFDSRTGLISISFTNDKFTEVCRKSWIKKYRCSGAMVRNSRRNMDQQVCRLRKNK